MNSEVSFNNGVWQVVTSIVYQLQKVWLEKHAGFPCVVLASGQRLNTSGFKKQKSTGLRFKWASWTCGSPPLATNQPGNICLKILIDIRLIWALASSCLLQTFSKTFTSNALIVAIPTARLWDSPTTHCTERKNWEVIFPQPGEFVMSSLLYYCNLT